MVVPIVVAAGARAAATTAARAGASAATRTGASAVSSGGRAAARSTASAARSASADSGRNIVRTRRSGGSATTSSAERPLRPSRSKAIDRAENVVRNQAGGSSVQDEYDEEEEMNSSTSVKRDPRIGTVVAAILVFIAFVFDVLEVVLDIVGVGIGGFIKDFIQIPFFIIAFWALKVPFWEGRKRIAKIVAYVAMNIWALIPIVSTATPEATIGVLAIIVLSRIEDAGLTQEELEALEQKIRKTGDGIKRIIRSRRG